MHYMEKRSMKLGRLHTSVALEPEFWAEVELLAQRRGVSIPGMIVDIDAVKPAGQSLASAVRCAVLKARVRHDDRPPAA